CFALIFRFSVEILQLGAVPASESNIETLRLLSFGTFLMSIASLPYYLGLSHGRVKDSVQVGAANLLVSIPLYYWSIRSFGLVGAAVPWVFINSASLLFLTYRVHGALHGRIVAKWWGTVLLLAIPTTLLAVLV